MILFLNTGREALQRATSASNIEDNHCSGISGDDDGEDDGYQVSFSTSQISRGFLWQKTKTVLSLKIYLPYFYRHCPKLKMKPQNTQFSKTNHLCQISMDKPPARIRAVRLPNDPFLQVGSQLVDK